MMAAMMGHTLKKEEQKKCALIGTGNIPFLTLLLSIVLVQSAEALVLMNGSSARQPSDLVAIDYAIGAKEILTNLMKSSKGHEYAEMYKGANCQKWREKADVNAWYRSQIPDCYAGMAQEVFVTRLPYNETDLVYVRNQKAGSQYFCSELGPMLGVHQEKRILLKHVPLNGIAKDDPASHHCGSFQDATYQNRMFRTPFVFTAVRDPMATALDAYLEVSQRMHGTHLMDDKKREHPQPAFYSLPCDSVADATKRFKTYLKDVRSGKLMTDQFFHSYPQALKIDVVMDAQYSGIFKLENISDLGELPGFKEIAPRSERSDHSKASKPCAKVDMEDSEIMALLCDMYRVDYECFDYELPAACK